MLSYKTNFDVNQAACILMVHFEPGVSHSREWLLI